MLFHRTADPRTLMIMVLISFSLACEDAVETQEPGPHCFEIIDDDAACRAAGCFSTSQQTYFYTQNEGCSEGDVLDVCLIEDGGDAQISYYWRQLDDQRFQTWSYNVSTNVGEAWTNCDDENTSTWREACRCNPSYQR